MVTGDQAMPRLGQYANASIMALRELLAR